MLNLKGDIGDNAPYRFIKRNSCLHTSRIESAISRNTRVDVDFQHPRVSCVINPKIYPGVAIHPKGFPAVKANITHGAEQRLVIWRQVKSSVCVDILKAILNPFGGVANNMRLVGSIVTKYDFGWR